LEFRRVLFRSDHIDGCKWTIESILASLEHTRAPRPVERGTKRPSILDDAAVDQRASDLAAARALRDLDEELCSVVALVRLRHADPQDGAGENGAADAGHEDEDEEERELSHREHGGS